MAVNLKPEICMKRQNLAQCPTLACQRTKIHFRGHTLHKYDL